MGDLTATNAVEVSYMMHIATTSLPTSNRPSLPTTPSTSLQQQQQRHMVATSTSDRLIKLYDFNPSSGNRRYLQPIDAIEAKHGALTLIGRPTV
jgi:hypothetical protein